MIRYDLRCVAGHAFDSWFGSAAAFDTLAARGAIVCPECGTDAVEKAPMAPRVVTAPAPERPIDRLRRHLEEEADYVGRDFAAEARAIHRGEAPDRPIWGEARGSEARELAEEGVAVLPLPFRRRSGLQ